MKTERRPKFQRPCPIPDCDWQQVTAWYVGGPDHVEEVPEAFLRMEGENHLINAHYTAARTLFT